MSSIETIKQSILAYMKKREEKAFETKDLSTGMDMDGFAEFKQLVTALADLEREGRVFLTKSGLFKLTAEKDVLTGKFHANDCGFGFVEMEGEEQDAFIPPNKTNYAMEGDIVSLELTKPADPKSGKGPEGMVLAVLEHRVSQLVGEFTAYDDKGVDETGFYGFVEPNDKRLASLRVFIEAQGIRPVSESVVLVEITRYPSTENSGSMQGLVAKTLGYKNEPGIDILSVVYKHGIPSEFPDEVIKEAEAIPDRVLPSELEGRRDLRNEVLVTIDGADAKDLDDAIHVRKLDNGHFVLGVHIADVAHYVRDNSAIDEEAFKRGTSVYLTDRVIPMLPQLLSNGICSLNPHVDRLTLTCEMEFDATGKRVRYDVYPSVINTTERMTYTAVNAIITDQDPATREQYAPLVPMFEAMGALHELLETRRVARGSIDFETNEAKIIVDDLGNPIDIEVLDRGVGERMIESFMLSANEAVSEHYTKKQLPILYRIHDQPDAVKMQTFMEFVTAFGISMKGTSEDVSPRALQTVLDKVSGQPGEAVVSMLLLRSMKQAKYDVDPIGHFGLAAEFYSHFTSPIRRYPDLILHRLIHYYAEVGTSKKDKSKWAERLPQIAEHSSIAERRAIDAERETDSMKKAEYMENKIGETYEGVIVSVTGFGMFIQLPNTIEGLIHISNMKQDFFEFDEKNMMLVGQRTGVIYRIGHKIKVKVTDASAELRQVDFAIAEDNEAEMMSAEELRKLKASKPRKPRSSSNGRRRDGGKPSFDKSKGSKKPFDSKNKHKNKR